MWSPSKPLTALKIRDNDAILQNLEDLRHKKSDINWVLMSYNNADELVFSGNGKGGLEELKTKFQEDDIRYAVLEVLVKGDEYNPVKFVLITWIGSKVSPGLAKAKCAGHRIELLDFIKTKIGIAGEFQPAFRSDLTSESVAAKLTRVAKHDVTSNSAVVDKRHQMSRPETSVGDKSKSQAKLADPDAISEGLRKVHKGEATWATLGYVEGKKDEIQFLKTGSGLSNLKSEFPSDRIVYAVYSQPVKETTNVTNKVLLLTMVGESTGPLVKARSGAHRAELADFILGFMPFHSHYQALSKDDLAEDKFLEKLRA